MTIKTGGTKDTKLSAEIGAYMGKVTTAFTSFTDDKMMNDYFTTGQGKKDFDALGVRPDQLDIFQKMYDQAGIDASKLKLTDKDEILRITKEALTKIADGYKPSNYGAQRTDITDAKVKTTVTGIVTELFGKTSDREIQNYLTSGDLNKKLQKDLNLTDSDL